MTDSAAPHESTHNESVALGILEGSLRWYARSAWNSKIRYLASESALLLVGALIPAAAAFTSDPRVTAGLGVLVVVLTGMRQLFRWRENWIRNTDTCSRLSTERTLYAVRERPYNGDDCDQQLVTRVRYIEAAATETWMDMLAHSESPTNKGSRQRSD